jgi:hypothetical protein
MQQQQQQQGLDSEAMKTRLIMEELRRQEQRRHQQEWFQQLSGGSLGAFPRPLTTHNNNNNATPMDAASLREKFPLSSALLGSISSLRASGRLPATSAGNSSGADALLLNELQERIRAAGGASSLYGGGPPGIGFPSVSSSSSAAATAPHLSSSVSAPVGNTASSFGSSLGMTQDELLSRAAGLLQNNNNVASGDLSSLLNTLNAESVIQNRGSRMAATPAGVTAANSTPIPERKVSASKPASLKRQNSGNENREEIISTNKRASNSSSQPLKKRRHATPSRPNNGAGGTFPQMGTNTNHQRPALRSFRKMWDNVKTQDKHFPQELFLRKIHDGRTPLSVGSRVLKAQKPILASDTPVTTAATSKSSAASTEEEQSTKLAVSNLVSLSSTSSKGGQEYARCEAV